MKTILKQQVKKILAQAGYEVSRITKSSADLLLGLKGLDIKSIIDIGSNEGQFAKYILSIFPDAHLYCFEPLPLFFNKLSSWAQANKNISVFNCAIGDRNEIGTMFYHTEDSVSSSLLKSTVVCENLYPSTRNKVLIPTKIATLDSVISSLATPIIPDVLIKLDVQGFEDRVIRGGKITFSKAKACIVEINLDKLYDGQPTFYDILMLFSDLGYVYSGNLEQRYANDGHVVWVDAVFKKI